MTTSTSDFHSLSYVPSKHSEIFHFILLPKIVKICRFLKEIFISKSFLLKNYFICSKIY